MALSTITELYEFNLDGVYYTFTPKISTISFGGKTYIPTIISRSGITVSDNVLKNSLTIKFPRTNSFARLLLATNIENPVTFTLYRNGLVYWQGQVLNTSASGLFIELECSSTYSKNTRPAITSRIQISCRHVLYGEACGAVKDTFAVAGTINTVSTDGQTLTLLAIAQPDNYFLNGEVLWNSQKRNIIKHVGLTLKLTSPFKLQPAGIVTLYPGCDHLETTCETKFSNRINYGGFTKLPTKNPHDNQGLL